MLPATDEDAALGPIRRRVRALFAPRAHTVIRSGEMLFAVPIRTSARPGGRMYVFTANEMNDARQRARSMAGILPKGMI